jgi:hypothetical protein
MNPADVLRGRRPEQTPIPAFWPARILIRARLGNPDWRLRLPEGDMIAVRHEPCEKRDIDTRTAYCFRRFQVFAGSTRKSIGPTAIAIGPIRSAKSAQ